VNFGDPPTGKIDLGRRGTGSQCHRNNCKQGKDENSNPADFQHQSSTDKTTGIIAKDGTVMQGDAPTMAGCVLEVIRCVTNRAP
jgi:hypothetical protein